MSLTRFGNSAWFTAESLGTATVQLVLAAWIINRLGLEQYGHWAMALALCNLAAVAGFGLASGLALTIQDARPTERLGWYVAAVSISLPVGLVILGSALLILQQAAPLLDNAGTASLAGTLLTVTLPLSLLVIGNESAMLAASALRGTGAYAAAARSGLLGSLAQLLIIGGLAALQASLVALLVASATLALARSLLLARRLHHPGRADAGTAGLGLRSRLRHLLRLARWQWLRSASTVVFVTLDRVLVGQFLGAAALAVYVVCVSLAEAVNRMASSLLQPTLLWAGRLRSEGRSMRPFWRRLLLVEAGVLAGGAAAAMIGPFLLPLWLASEAQHHVPLLWMAIGTATLTALHALPVYLLTGSGHNRRLALTSLLATALAIASIPLLAPWGLFAVIAGRLLYGATLFACWPALRRSPARFPAAAP